MFKNCTTAEKQNGMPPKAHAHHSMQYFQHGASVLRVSSVGNNGGWHQGLNFLRCHYQPNFKSKMSGDTPRKAKRALSGV